MFNTDIETHFLDLAKTMLVRLNDRYLAGLSLVNDTQIVAWFNNQPLHTTALSLSLVHNAMIKSKLGPEYSVDVVNYPLPFRIESTMSLLMMAQNMGFQLATNVSFAMAFVSSFYIMFYIKERVSKAKLLQYVSGLNISSFWITSFLFDYGTFILNCIVMISVLAVFQEDGWSTFGELMPGFVTLIVFGFSMLPISFLSSHLFEIPSTGFVRMTIVYVFTGEYSVSFALLSVRVFNVYFLPHRHYRFLCHGCNVISCIQTNRDSRQNEMVFPRVPALFVEQQPVQFESNNNNGSRMHETMRTNPDVYA